ncbi:hybrid sensor histidine kinase/response regulator [Desulfonatronovibrio magnus]|uniref:hybrid sensor histidine kinase/response regulator n=1 Tax=Desulfonatronovibrio magnus TaxID=698827 RepID=UPI00069743BA|nr:response regulator [Desulfonatronovibrio magnus]RQD60703.1 MAG: hybrid sensor histidine kinase/response regulator [Desulfonatronovibrio sp. MSAO_Bac4]
MIKLFGRQIQRSLTKDLIVGISLSLAVLLTALGAIFYFYLTERYSADIQNRSEMLSDEIAHVLSRPAWNLDHDFATHIASAYLHNEIVSGIRLIFSPETVVFDHIPDHNGQDLFGKTRDIYFENDFFEPHVVGEVEIWFSRHQIHEMQNNIIRIVGVTLLSSIVIIVLVIQILMSLLLKRPLSSLHKSIRSIAAGNYKSFIRPVPQEDINAIISDVNLMAECIADHTSRLSLEINDRKQVEKDLRERGRQLQSLSDNLPDGYVYQCIMSDDEKRFTYISAGAQRLHKVSVTDILADYRAFYNLFTEQDREHILEQENRATETMSQFNTTARYISPDNELRWMSLTAAPRLTAEGDLVWEGIAMDITAQKNLEEQLRQSQKMESVGILAGGIAHDFNNILQAMSGNIQLILMHKSKNDHDTKRLEIIAGSIDRAARLVRQLLLFSRKADVMRQCLDLNTIARDSIVMLQRIIPKMISVQFAPDENLWTIEADPVQVEQVILNLGTNAADAMLEGGRLTIETKNVDLDDDYVSSQLDIQPGQYVMLCISDTGHGMDTVTLASIYDPFFTTKEVGKGTGLGLATVYGIVKSHGGSIHCYSEPGQGTTFRIYWPRAVNEPALKALDQPEVESSWIVKGNETILVVDDDLDILELTAEALEGYGYQILTAASGEEALSKYSERKGEIDMVILDLNMPGMGGRQCLDQLLTKDAAVKVLVASGYSLTGQAADVLKSGAAGYIGKPFQFSELLIKIREILSKGE